MATIRKTATEITKIHRDKKAVEGAFYISSDGRTYRGVDGRLHEVGTKESELLNEQINNIEDIDRETIIERLEAVPNKADKCEAIAWSIVF